MLHFCPFGFQRITKNLHNCIFSFSFLSFFLDSQIHTSLCTSRGCLTHWGRVTHIRVVKITIIGSDNGLSPGRRQAIIWTNAGILLIGPLGTNFIKILIGIQTFSFKKMHLKMSSAKWRPFCLGLNVLNSESPHARSWGIGSYGIGLFISEYQSGIGCCVCVCVSRVTIYGL